MVLITHTWLQWQQPILKKKKQEQNPKLRALGLVLHKIKSKGLPQNACSSARKREQMQQHRLVDKLVMSELHYNLMCIFSCKLQAQQNDLSFFHQSSTNPPKKPVLLAFAFINATVVSGQPNTITRHCLRTKQ